MNFIRRPGRMKLFGLALALCVIFPVCASGQNTEEAEKIVRVRVIGSVDKFKPGHSYPIALKLQVRAPYHINADQPLDEFLIPTTISFKSQPGITFGKMDFPPAQMKHFEFSENPLAVFENTVIILTSVTLPPGFAASEFVVEGTIGYQACDNSSCLPPAEEAFRQRFSVAGTDESVTEINKEIFSKSAKEDLPSDQKNGRVLERTVFKSFHKRGLLLTFLLVFIGGLALNLTPCVYPLIPITISYFGGQSQGRKGSLIAHAGLYVIGMAVTYSALGVTAAFTGGLFGGALQYPPVLLAIALVMILLALSMFNVYELRVPAFLSRLAGGSKKGFFGTFLMGLTVGIVAAPCIGPFVLGLLTYVGDKGNVLLGFGLFFVLALGLGIPFLFLAIFSGSLSRLPRSGAWMVWVRTIFGFVLIAMAIYFLKPLFPNTLFYSLGMALILCIGGIYMAWIEPTRTSGKIFPIVRNLVGVAFFIVGLSFAANGIQDYLNDALASRTEMGADFVIDERAIQWFPFSEEKMAEAGRLGQPVLIDFYADWCLPCKELEKFTFSDPEVIATSRSFIMLKVDLTTVQSPQAGELRQRFQIKGVPTLVFLTPDGREFLDLRVSGFEDKKEFLQIMKRALELSRGK
ncbi:MAG: cytochrome c biogenesis protein CcdA [Candidatus Aminicenantales bacterium]